MIIDKSLNKTKDLDFEESINLSVMPLQLAVNIVPNEWQQGGVSGGSHSGIIVKRQAQTRGHRSRLKEINRRYLRIVLQEILLLQPLLPGLHPIIPLQLGPAVTAVVRSDRTRSQPYHMDYTKTTTKFWILGFIFLRLCLATQEMEKFQLKIYSSKKAKKKKKP